MRLVEMADLLGVKEENFPEGIDGQRDDDVEGFWEYYTEDEICQVKLS